MRKQEQRQKRVLAAAFALSLLGSAATTSLGAAAKSSKAHYVHRHTQRQAHPARRGVASLSTGEATHASVSLGAAGGPLRFTPQQWQDYGEMMRRESGSGDLVKQGDANSAVVAVPPGLDTLPFAEAQEAAKASEAGQKALAAGDLNEAEAEFRSSVELNASDPVALAGFAQTLEQEGKSQQAISVYRYLLYPKKGWGTSMEQDPALRMRFASLLASDGQWAEAVSVYESTIGGVSIGPAYPSLEVHFTADALQPALFQTMVHLALGVTYNGRLEHSQALTQYAAAIKVMPDSALAHYCYGYGLQRLGRRVEAQAAFQQAATLDNGEIKKAALKELPALMQPRESRHEGEAKTPGLSDEAGRFCV